MKELKHVAMEVEDQVTLDRLLRAEEIQSRSHTHVAIMGTTNCGKTTLINGILGQEIREPSMLPDEGKPLRVSFEHMDADDRCNCETVFNREWGGIDVLLYEVSSDRVFGSPGNLTADDFDVLFYIMPANRMMTAEDKKVLTSLSYLPINIIISKLDEVSTEQRTRIIDYAQKIADDHVAQLILSDSSDWTQVSKKMRDSLPITLNLTKLRQEHMAVIKSECKERLISALDDAIAEQRAIINSVEQKNRVQMEQLRFDSAIHSRDISSLKLDCTKTENTINEQIRKMLPNTLQFADAKLQDAKKQNYSKESLAKLGNQVERYILQQIDKIDSSLQNEVRRIVADAQSKQLMGSNEADAFLSKFFGKKAVNSVPVTDYGKYSAVSTDSLIKVGLAVGGVSVAAWLLPVSTVLSCGITAVAVAVGGVQFFQKMAIGKESTAHTLRNEIQKLVKNVQASLAANAENVFSTLKTSFNVPTASRTNEVDTTVQQECIAHFENLKAELVK